MGNLSSKHIGTLPDILLIGVGLLSFALILIALLDYWVLAHLKVPLIWRLNPMPFWTFDWQERAKIYKKKPRLIIITGGNEGIGKETALQLAQTGAHIIIASRNEARSIESVKDIQFVSQNFNVHYKYLDLSSFASIRSFIKEIEHIVVSSPAEVASFLALSNDHHSGLKYSKLTKVPLYALINNSGVMLLPEKRLSEDGIEMTFAVNYFGPFLLTNLILPFLKHGSEALNTPTRIINVSSRAHIIGPTKIDLGNLKSEKYFNRHMVYGNSKLALIMFTRQLAHLLDEEKKRESCAWDVRCFSLHPGTVDTKLFKYVPQPFKFIVSKYFSVTPKEGAMTSLYCTVDEDPLLCPNGSYFTECHIAKESSKALNTDLNNRLWNVSRDICHL